MGVFLLWVCQMGQSRQKGTFWGMHVHPSHSDSIIYYEANTTSISVLLEIKLAKRHRVTSP